MQCPVLREAMLRPVVTILAKSLPPQVGPLHCEMKYQQMRAGDGDASTGAGVVLPTDSGTDVAYGAIIQTDMLWALTFMSYTPVSYTHLRAHETEADL
eukprot:633157-Rhodomonas_salina.1